MDEREKRAMYIEEIFGKVVAEAERRDSGDELRDPYSVFVDLGVLTCYMANQLRKEGGG